MSARWQAAYGPITAEQQRRMDEDRDRTLTKRAAARYTPILDRFDKSGVNCARCVHIGGFDAERQCGWCMQLRHMAGTWHNCTCNAFEADK